MPAIGTEIRLLCPDNNQYYMGVVTKHMKNEEVRIDFPPRGKEGASFLHLTKKKIDKFAQVVSFFTLTSV